jgi:hypothetical protein
LTRFGPSICVADLVGIATVRSGLHYDWHHSLGTNRPLSPPNSEHASTKRSALCRRSVSHLTNSWSFHEWWRFIVMMPFLCAADFIASRRVCCFRQYAGCHSHRALHADHPGHSTEELPARNRQGFFGSCRLRRLLPRDAVGLQLAAVGEATTSW